MNGQLVIDGNIAGFRSIKKPVILEIPTIIISTPTGKDISFLTKMQKTIVTVWFKFLGLYQLIDIN